MNSYGTIAMLGSIISVALSLSSVLAEEAWVGVVTDIGLVPMRQSYIDAVPKECDQDCAEVYKWVREGDHIAYCESGQQDWKVGAAGERGRFQLHPLHAWRFWRQGWSWDDAFDAVKNSFIAREIYLESGWQPWSCARNSIPP